MTIPELHEIGIPITAPISSGPGELISGLLPMNGQLVIAGETDVGKSLLALEMISSLVSGDKLWGQLLPNKRIHRVAYCLGEHYAEVIMNLARLTKLPFTDQVIILGPEQLAWDKWLVSNGTVNLQSAKKFSVWFKGVDLVIWDPLSAFISGSDAENDNVQMRLVLQTMNDLSHAAGASCIVLAHQGKPSMDQYGKEHARKSYAIRGASAIEDAATNIFYMGKYDTSSATAQNVPPDVKILSLRRRKYKGTAPEEYRLMRDPATLCHTMLTTNRPVMEVQRADTLSKLARLQHQFPDMSHKEAILAVACIQNLSERTVRNYLE